MLKFTYSNLEFQIFPGDDPRTTLFKGRGWKGKDREGTGWTGRDGREEWVDSGERRGGALDMGSASP